MAELPDTTHEQITTLCREGDDFADEEDYPSALEWYWDAWDLLPEPKTDWGVATEILAAIGDANFFAGDDVAGVKNLTLAMRCPSAIGNAFLHLRLGQCQFELGDMARAGDELTRALMGGGTELFDGEDEKYLAFVKTLLEPPPGGW